MKKLELFKTLRRHRKLSEKRALNYNQNKAGKITVYIAFSCMLLYLIFIAIMFSLITNKSTDVTPLEFIFGISPFVLLVDFFVRFITQQTPSQLVKPYILLPIPRYACINTFLATSLLNTGNLTWFAMLVPFTLMSILFNYSIWITFGFLLLWWMMILVNSQWYIICRTKITDSQFWWFLPIGVYALEAIPIILDLGKEKGWENFFNLYAHIGTFLERGNILPFIVVIALLIILIEINKKIQYTHIWKELSKVEETHLRKVTGFTFLDKYGEIGQYLKLEIKSIMRNKNPRKSFISGTILVLMFSFLISFTDVYNDRFSTNFWCIYCFVIFGAMNLIKVMCQEGNYMDGLMIHKENILSLLKAKYLFYCLFLFFPFLLMLPTVFTGKWSLFMLISYGVFTAGFQYFILFQMAVYNKQTIPLNTKFISKGNIENNYFQFAAEMVAFIIPMILVSIIQTFFGNNMSYIIMFIIGITFIIANNLWLRNIYNRLMKRRYKNLESFRASR